eukprot:CAMPEP_0198148140 /NCGR_PEP_ID=MMETSP1443-20131203/40056_1 /TAXON_ID=186043 /ORGANISM="Entomoneis sp., Strain CCMP2396" /LENGTH=560 /DNA_ID=CAMNT_0043812747 /DNA_START=61 /DNA_END=1743 /DNA_ORIENTATION=+
MAASLIAPKNSFLVQRMLRSLPRQSVALAAILSRHQTTWALVSTVDATPYPFQWHASPSTARNFTSKSPPPPPINNYDYEGKALQMLHQIHNQFVSLMSGRDYPLVLPKLWSLTTQFVQAYLQLPSLNLASEFCQRTRILQYLADCNDQLQVDIQILKGNIVLEEEKMKNSLFPFLIEIRRDLLQCIAISNYNKDGAKNYEALKKLDSTLISQVFTSFFQIPDSLTLRQIDTASSHSILERLVQYEAVHPVDSVHQLTTRLGPNNQRRVYSLFHQESLPNQPLVVLYVALLDAIPSTMDEIHNLPSNDLSPPPTVATFYSISSHCSGLASLGLGESLIERAAKHLQTETTPIDTFCTLSPLPSFRSWLMERFLINDYTDIPAPSKNVLDAIKSNVSNCSLGNPAATIKDLSPFEILKSALDLLSQQVCLGGRTCLGDQTTTGPKWDSDTQKLYKSLEPWLIQIAAQYLAVVKKDGGRPYDSVLRFHVGNGAILYKLHSAADTSLFSWQNSFGIMVTYKYDLRMKLLNQTNHWQNSEIPLGPDIQLLLSSVDNSTIQDQDR